MADLHELKPQADKHHDDAVRLLKEALATLEGGERASSVLVIINKPGGDWIELASASVGITDWLGRLEFLKFSKVQAYMQQEDLERGG